MSSIKPRLAPSAVELPRFKSLIVRHPCYDDGNILLNLPALCEGDTIDYDTALTICGIISGNSYGSGWFATSQDGNDVCPSEAPLKAGAVYYFATANPTYKYPICPTWDEWCPPSTESALPSALAAFKIPEPPSSLGAGGYMDNLKKRDDSCRVTGIVDFCEQAHLIPASEREWWDAKMPGIVESGVGLESSQNGIYLRADLHRSFDYGIWVPVIKESRMVVHVLRHLNISKQFIGLYHDREMQELVGIDKQCLFARVAYSVLPLLSEFLAGRRLAKGNTLLKINGEVQEWTPEACKTFKSKPRSRIPSPTKRPRLEQDEENGLVVAAKWHKADEDMDRGNNNATTPIPSFANRPRLELVKENGLVVAAKWHEDDEDTDQEKDAFRNEDDPPRGRKRQRSSSWHSICLPKRKRGQPNLAVNYPSPLSS